MRAPIFVVSKIIEILMREESVIEANLDIAGVSFGDPVNGAFYFAAVRRVAALGRRVISAMHFSDIARGVFNAVRALNIIAPA